MAKKKAKKKAQRMQEASRREVEKEEYGSDFCKRRYHPQQRHSDKKRDQSRRACRKFKHNQQED